MLRSGTLPILPAGTAVFMRRRLSEIGGLLILVFAALLLATLVSYDPADPSFNNATGADPANWLGRPGGYVADLFLHSYGAAALVLVLGLAGWGWRLCRKLPLTRPVLRAGALILAVALLAVALAGVPAVPGWPLIAGTGGVIGGASLHAVLALVHAANGGLDPTVVSGLCATLAIAAFLYGSGLSFADWGMVWRAPAHSIAAVRGFATQTAETAQRIADRAKGLSTHFRSRDRNRSGSRGETTIEDDIDDDIYEEDERYDDRPESFDADEKQPTDDDRDVVVVPRPRPKRERKSGTTTQGRLDFDQPARYRPPLLDLLRPTPPSIGDGLSRDALEQNARMLKTVLDDFSVRGEIGRVRPGPVVTLYELEPAPGTKSSRVIGLADDIARSMSAISARVAVIPGRNAIGIELPNQRRETVGLRELLASESFERTSGQLNLALGKDIGGTPVIADLARMPHLLIAGTTGSGKSVAINAMILSLLYRMTPSECKLILIDPKMLELSVYDGIPHLLTPVVTEPGKAVVALKWTVREMEERYRSMSQLGVRNVAGFNARVADAKQKNEPLSRRVQTGYDDNGQPVFEEQTLELSPLPLIVVVVDEMADLMLVAGKDIEAAVQRLSQMARAAGIHLIMATQRPSVDVITGTIKANFPTRVSFQVSSKIDSRTILGEQGAEQLLGQGDMLYMAAGGRVTRVHGPFVSDAEVESVVRHLKTQGEPTYIEAITQAEDEDGEPGAIAADEEQDDLYEEAREMVRRERKASTSFIQRRLQIGYNRAARIIERMEAEGLVSKPDRVGRREVLIRGDDD